MCQAVAEARPRAKHTLHLLLVSRHNYRKRLWHRKGSCSSPTAPAHLGHRKHPALVAAAAIPGHRHEDKGTKTCPPVCCSPQHCVTTAGTGGTAPSTPPSPTLLLGFSPSSCHQTCPAPLETNTHCGNSHCPPLSNLWFPVMDSTSLSNEEDIFATKCTGRNTWNSNWWRHWSHLLMWSNGHLLSKRGCQFALHNLEVLFPLFWKKPLGTRWLRDLVIEYEPSHLSIDHSNMTYCVSQRKASDYLLVSCTKWDIHPLLQPSSSWTDFPVEIAGFCSGNLTFSFKKKSSLPGLWAAVSCLLGQSWAWLLPHPWHRCLPVTQGRDSSELMSSGPCNSWVKVPCVQCLANAPQREEHAGMGLWLYQGNFLGKTLLEAVEEMKLHISADLGWALQGKAVWWWMEGNLWQNTFIILPT